MIARTACFNVASTVAAALSGIIVARAVGPAVRGEYAAVTAWFGLLLMAGGVGQPAAVCFYVARYPRRARGYVATSRTMMLHRRGRLAAPAWQAAHRPRPRESRAHAGLPDRLRQLGHRLRRRELHLRAAGQGHQAVEPGPGQPAAARPGGHHRCCGGCGSSRLHTAIGVVTVTMAIQLGYAYYWCRRTGLGSRFGRDPPGRAARTVRAGRSSPR